MTMTGTRLECHFCLEIRRFLSDRWHPFFGGMEIYSEPLLRCNESQLGALMPGNDVKLEMILAACELGSFSLLASHLSHDPDNDAQLW